MAPADTVSLRRIVERRPFPQTRRLSFTLAPGARDPHAGSLACRVRAVVVSRGPMLSQVCCYSTGNATRLRISDEDAIEDSQGLATHSRIDSEPDWQGLTIFGGRFRAGDDFRAA